jgi:hypothetical protein
MGNLDMAVSSVGIPNYTNVVMKPPFLIALEDTIGKSKSIRYFLTIDRPDVASEFVQAKGIFIDSSVSEDDIIKNYSQMLTDAKKELILEMWLPWRRIIYVRNLVFKAK